MAGTDEGTPIIHYTYDSYQGENFDSFKVIHRVVVPVPSPDEVTCTYSSKAYEKLHQVTCCTLI